MAADDLPGLARRLSKEFDLDEVKVAVALSEALAAYCEEAAFQEGQSERSDHCHKIAQLRDAVARLQKRWRGLEPDLRGSVQWFIGESDIHGEVDVKLDDVFGLFDECVEHYGRRKGNPGKSHLVEGESLRAIVVFCIPLIGFWQAHTGKSFNVDVDVRGNSRNAIAPDEMRFLQRAADELIGSAFPIGTIETAAREIVRPRRRSS